MTRRSFKPRSLAPPMAAAAVIALAWWRVDATWSNVPEASDEYMAAVAESIDSVPYKIGPWLGFDVEVSEAAVEMLKPNRILQRVYRKPNDASSQFSLLISHCGVTRDMLGHYPPVCYPAHGWTQLGVRDVSLKTDDTEIPAREYSFRRGVGLESAAMTVMNFFVVPSDTERYQVTMDQLNSFEVTQSRHAKGIAQIQILVPEEMKPAQREEVVDDVLHAIEGVTRTITTRSEA
ncbi:MAG: hypothetical protein CMJ31_10420 [Phycisphaerae bacterium]|nr:hypothetical protein [Phycisphaerae bacterium]